MENIDSRCWEEGQVGAEKQEGDIKKEGQEDIKEESGNIKDAGEAAAKNS